jgi:hypothetical protein
MVAKRKLKPGWSNANTRIDCSAGYTRLIGIEGCEERNLKTGDVISAAIAAPVDIYLSTTQLVTADTTTQAVVHQILQNPLPQQVAAPVAAQLGSPQGPPVNSSVEGKSPAAAVPLPASADASPFLLTAASELLSATNAADSGSQADLQSDVSSVVIDEFDVHSEGFYGEIVIHGHVTFFERFYGQLYNYDAYGATVVFGGCLAGQSTTTDGNGQFWLVLPNAPPGQISEATATYAGLTSAPIIYSF